MAWNEDLVNDLEGLNTPMETLTTQSVAFQLNWYEGVYNAGSLG